MALPPTLADRIAAFTRALREAGLWVNTTSAMTALRAVAAIDVLNPDQFYYALQAALTASPQEQALFSAVFAEFWGIRVGDGEPTAGPQVAGPSAARQEEAEQQEQTEADDLPARPAGPEAGAPESGGEERDSDAAPSDPGRKPSPAETGGSSGGDGGVATETTGGQRGGASLAEVKSMRVFTRTGEAEIARLRRLVSRLLAPLRYLPASRRRPRLNSGDLDLRSTLRRSLRHAGELVELRRRGKAPARVDLVVMLDVSGSMDTHTEFMLQFIYAIQASTRNVESFVFSTRLSRITPYMRRGYNAARAEVARRVRHWSGGTRLGESLQAFNDRYGLSCSGSSTCAIIICDGWDRGEPEVLEAELERLSRRVRALIWLNPLLGVPGYQPLARGLQIAERYVTAFLPARDAESLGKAIELIGLRKV